MATYVRDTSKFTAFACKRTIARSKDPSNCLARDRTSFHGYLNSFFLRMYTVLRP